MKDKPLTKRKLLKDRQMPSPEQVSMRQDFNRISNSHAFMQKLLLKKTLAWGGGIIGTAAIATLVVLNMNKTPEKTSAPASQTAAMQPAAASQPSVLSPLPAKQEAFITYKVSAKNGGTISYPTGSTLTIPANAFLNTSSDSITIRYREFHDPLSIFLSGIPMGYDSAGTKYTLQSAGMLQIMAFDGSTPIQLDPQKPIEVRMASGNDDKNYNMYQLDTVANNWVYKGKDKIINAVPQNPQAITTAKKTAGNKTVADNAVKPALSDPQKYCFKIGYDKNDFPELAAYDNVLFEVHDNTFKPVYYKINWNKISLQSTDTKGTYSVKLKKADTTITVNAVPVFDQANYAAALSKFDAQQKQINENENKTAAENRAKLNTVNTNIKYDMAQFKAAAKVLRTSRIFMISQMGYYNCDQPMPPSPLFVMVTDLEKQKNTDKQIDYKTIYLIEKGKNTVFRFAKSQPIVFDAHSEKLMWTITTKNEIAFFRGVDFNKLAGHPAALKPVVAKDQDVALAEIRKFSE